MEEEDESRAASEARLWQIDTERPQTLGMGPIVLILVVLAVAIVLGTMPCMQMRIDFLMVEKPQGMTFWGMSCKREQGQCVCRQGSRSLRGNGECTLRRDMQISCKAIPDDPRLEKK